MTTKLTLRGAFRVSPSMVLFDNLSVKLVEFDSVRLSIMSSNEEDFLSDVYSFPPLFMCASVLQFIFLTSIFDLLYRESSHTTITTRNEFLILLE